MRVVIVPGYGDRADYLKKLSDRWLKRFGSELVIVPFGWSGEVASFDAKDLNFMDRIKSMGEVGIIGISAGASAALRAQQLLGDQVRKVVTVCGPVHASLMNKDTLHDKYSLLEQSLAKLQPKKIPAEDVLTLRPLYDELVPVQAMKLEGATDIRMKMIGHGPSILWAMYRHAQDMNNFLSE